MFDFTNPDSRKWWANGELIPGPTDASRHNSPLGLTLAVGETVILLTLSLHHY